MPKPISEDHGRILTLGKCPECKAAAGYKLMQQIYPSPKLFKLFIKDTSMWHIECEECKNSVKVPNHEAEKIPEVKELFTKMSEGQITEEEFYGVFGQFTFIADLLNQEHSWVCPHCSEKVDWKFQVCWNCSTPNPDIESDSNKPEMPQFVPPSCGFNVIQQ